MGLFQFIGMTSWSSNPQRGTAPGRLWPELKWWPDGAPAQQPRLNSHLSLPLHSHLSHQPCAAGSRFSDRAPQSIRQNLLRRTWCWTVSSFRRWMLPTVERGPPGHAAFERRL
jgi:hypothetical protein